MQGGRGIDEVGLERAIELRLRNPRWSWEAIAIEVGVTKRTILRWKQRPEWRETTARVLARLPGSLTRLAALVLAKALEAELAKEEPNTTLALTLAERTMRELQPLPTRIDSTERSFQHHVIELPAETDGRDSLPPEQVLAAHLSGGRQVGEIPPPEEPSPKPKPAPADRARAALRRARKRKTATPAIELPAEDVGA